MKQITVLLADDRTIMREACRQMLEGEADLCVVGEAQDGRQAVEMVKRLHPDVVVMDIAMPHLNGLEASHQVTKAVPTTKVLILSAQSENVDITKAMEAGVAGYLTKHSSVHDLYRAVREVHRGKMFFSPGICRPRHRLHPQAFGRTGMINHRAAELTSRQREVLQLVAEGNANKQTAAELGISVKTVEKHRERLGAKLDIHDTAGLTRYAIGAGVIDVPLFGKPGIRYPESRASHRRSRRWEIIF